MFLPTNVKNSLFQNLTKLNILIIIMRNLHTYYSINCMKAPEIKDSIEEKEYLISEYKEKIWSDAF